eukprot:CAMPEP_0174827862 /NCGR_PEP_ID=MMETSP1114-20130205/975_1 /TAXON_ID=312471 /ORGANISM="Neobodo designis, Strain CCAP 1951/1" /LENGTH=163 /DNA_ID=CAMNT_0016061545 /DNA_START=85 /DNA_END=576 /DNA_ORIENTATION=+
MPLLRTLQRAIVCVAIAALGAAAQGADSSFFWQMLCENGGCNEGCTQTSLPTHRCLQMQGDASGIAYCDYTRNELVINQYIFSPNCTGGYETVRSTLMQCYPSDSGNYVEYMCPPPSKSHHRDDAKAGEEGLGGGAGQVQLAGAADVVRNMVLAGRKRVAPKP